MTGYPPGCPQNGPRHHTTLTSAVEHGWPGDTYTDFQGHKWTITTAGAWQPVVEPAKTVAA